MNTRSTAANTPNDDTGSGHSRPVLARKNMTRNGDLWFLPMPGFVKVAHSLGAAAQQIKNPNK
jgi:hypothetical protein